jgi:hypothetical protein
MSHNPECGEETGMGKNCRVFDKTACTSKLLKPSDPSDSAMRDEKMGIRGMSKLGEGCRAYHGSVKCDCSSRVKFIIFGKSSQRLRRTCKCRQNKCHQIKTDSSRHVKEER